MTEPSYIRTGDGCRIAYRFDGDPTKPVLLLSNSLGTDMGMWEAQLPALGTHFRILRYDSRGHGASGAPAGAYSMDRLGRDALELLDALELHSVSFCGVSKGGMVGQWLGIRAAGRISKLALCNTSSFMGPPDAWDVRITTVQKEGLASVADASLARWFTSQFRSQSPTEVDRIRHTLVGLDPIGYAGCCAAIRDMDMRRSVSLVSTPTLVIGGSEDPATPLVHSQFLADTIPGAQLHVLPAAHLSNIERPAEFNEALLSFFL